MLIINLNKNGEDMKFLEINKCIECPKCRYSKYLNSYYCIEDSPKGIIIDDVDVTKEISMICRLKGEINAVS